MTSTTTPSAAGPAAADEADLAEIRQVVVDYCEGYYRRDPEQTARAYHPECLKRSFMRTDDDVWYLSVQYRASMVDAAHLADRAVADPTYEIIVDDVADGIASVRLYSDAWVDFLHVGKVDGRWVIINVLWEMRPRSD